MGRLEDEKGVQRILDAFSTFEDSRDFVEEIHLIGDGEKRKFYENQVEANKLPVTFYGFLSRNEVFDIYKKSHFLLLPSTASEGFPKVIAEGMNFGCIPIVSDISSVGQYINADNGFVVNLTTAEKLASVLVEIQQLEEKILKAKAKQAYQVAVNFTFEHYNERIMKEIL